MDLTWEKDENGKPIRPKEAFKMGTGKDVLCLILNPETAKTLISMLTMAIRSKKEKGLGYADHFTINFCGTVIVVGKEIKSSL
jgi:hypothetical protein